MNYKIKANFFWSLLLAAVACWTLSLECLAEQKSKAEPKVVLDQTQVYKQWMIQMYNSGDYDRCITYAKSFMKGSTNRSETALGFYYCGNSSAKQHKFSDALIYYRNTLEWADKNLDKALIADCNQACKSIENGNTSVETPGSTEETAQEKMLDRAREQYANSVGFQSPDNDFRVKNRQQIEYWTAKKKEQENTILAYQSQPQIPGLAERIKDLQVGLDQINKRLDELKTANPPARAYQQELDRWQTTEKKAITRNQKLDTEPALKLVGSDYYTKNYGTAASQAAPKPADPNELTATEERMVLDAHSVPGKTISRIVKVPNETKPSNADLKVHGNLLP